MIFDYIFLYTLSSILSYYTFNTNEYEFVWNIILFWNINKVHVFEIRLRQEEYKLSWKKINKIIRSLLLILLRESFDKP